MPSPAYRHRTHYRAVRGKLKLSNMKIIEKIISGNFLRGKKTYLSIGLGLAGFFANKYGFKHEFDGVVEIVRLNSAELATLVGLIGAIWGRIVAKPNAGK